MRFAAVPRAAFRYACFLCSKGLVDACMSTRERGAVSLRAMPLNCLRAHSHYWYTVILDTHTHTLSLSLSLSLSVTRPLGFSLGGLQLADEEAGGEQAHALGQDVLGEDVDERWQEDKGHRRLVDEEEGNELGHGRLEDRLA